MYQTSLFSTKILAIFNIQSMDVFFLAYTLCEGGESQRMVVSMTQDSLRTTIPYIVFKAD
jgi:hypothetical protein